MTQKITEYRINKIVVDASLYTAKMDGEFVGIEEYDGRTGYCHEGHKIATGYVFEIPDTGEHIVFGSTCVYKVFLFKRWENIDISSVDKYLKWIGKTFWIMEKDGLWDELPDDYTYPIDLEVLPETEEDKIAYKKALKKIQDDAYSWKYKNELNRRMEETKNQFIAEIEANELLFKKFNEIVFNNPWAEDKRKSLIQWLIKSYHDHDAGLRECRGWTPGQRGFVESLMRKNAYTNAVVADKIDVLLEAIDTLIKRNDDDRFLGDWDTKFLPSIRNTIDRGYTLSDAQKKHVKRIMIKNDEFIYSKLDDFDDFVDNQL